MKSYIENLIKASLVMLAVVAAFAFTTPQEIFNGPFYHDGQNWIDLSSINYDCDEVSFPEEVCTYASESFDDPLDPGRIVLP